LTAIASISGSPVPIVERSNVTVEGGPSGPSHSGRSIGPVVPVSPSELPELPELPELSAVVVASLVLVLVLVLVSGEGVVVVVVVVVASVLSGSGWVELDSDAGDDDASPHASMKTGASHEQLRSLIDRDDARADRLIMGLAESVLLAV
jgi:hypothetical protein